MLSQTGNTERVDLHIQFVDEHAGEPNAGRFLTGGIDSQGQVFYRQVADLPFELTLATLVVPQASADAVAANDVMSVRIFCLLDPISLKNNKS